MRRHGTLAFLGAMAILLGALGVRAQLRAPIVHAAQTWAVQVGANVDLTNGVTANAFFPATITIDAGDTVGWSFPSVEPHTVTFDNGTNPPLEVSGRVKDLAAGTLEYSRLFNPLNANGPNQAFDSKVQVSSGVPSEPPDERTPFTLSFAQAGVYYYVCSIHGRDMSGTVTVQPAGAALAEAPAQATARGQSDLSGAVAYSAGFFTGNPPRDAAAATPSVHNIDAGASHGGGISLYQFLSRDITVHRGDTVVWTNASPDSAHTITFLSGGTEPQMTNIVPQAGGAPKLVRPANVYSLSGGTTYTGQGYLNSGFMPAGGSFAAVVDAPPGQYEYVCLLHAIEAPWNMKGTITVTQ